MLNAGIGIAQELQEQPLCLEEVSGVVQARERKIYEDIVFLEEAKCF